MTDQELLGEYAERRTESAFAEVVRRHVDFVYSAAVRMVRDQHLAEDVTQGVFVACAKNARELAGHPVLLGWLHRTAQNLAANVVRSEVRRRRREQEAFAMNELTSSGAEAAWENVAPLLDEALGELSEGDREAVWAQYFQRKSAREVAQVLGISEAAAQKRVSRAVERLREIFAKRGIAVGAGGLAVMLTANAIQAAPLGLAATITAASLVGATATGAVTATTIKTIAMTTLQKVFITAALTATVGASIYEMRQASALRQQVQALAPLADENQQLARERDEAATHLANLREENARLARNVEELPKLRGEVARLRTNHAGAQAGNSDPNDPLAQLANTWTARAAQLNQYLQQMPDKKIPELDFLSQNDWLKAAEKAKFDTDADIRRSLRDLRDIAKDNLPLGRALWSYIHDNDGQLPTDLSQLKKYFKSPVTDSSVSDWPGINSPSDEANLDTILSRYKLLQSGKFSDLPPGTWLVTEKAPVDKDYDTRIKFGPGTSSIFSTGVGEAGDPDDKNY